MSPSKCNQQAGVIIYEDDDNYVTLRRGHVHVEGVGNEVVWLVKEKDGQVEHKAIACSATGVELTLVRRRGIYTGYVTPAGGTAQQVGEFTGVDVSPAKVGICATDGDYDASSQLPCDFDWFKILE